MTTNDELLRRADELLDETVRYVSAALDKMQQRAERAEAERDEWKEKWRWERSHGCPDWGNHTSDGLDRVCWHRLPESWHDLLKDRDSARADRDSLRALLRDIRAHGRITGDIAVRLIAALGEGK